MPNNAKWLNKVRWDEHGLVPEELDATLTRLAAEGRRVAFLYTIPSFANPSGLLLPAERAGIEVERLLVDGRRC